MSRRIVGNGARVHSLGPGQLFWARVTGGTLLGDVRIYRGPAAIAPNVTRNPGGVLVGTLSSGAIVGTALNLSAQDFAGPGVQLVVEFDNAADNIEVDFNGYPKS